MRWIFFPFFSCVVNLNLSKIEFPDRFLFGWFCVYFYFWCASEPSKTVIKNPKSEKSCSAERGWVMLVWRDENGRNRVSDGIKCEGQAWTGRFCRPCHAYFLPILIHPSLLPQPLLLCHPIWAQMCLTRDIHHIKCLNFKEPFSTWAQKIGGALKRDVMKKKRSQRVESSSGSSEST